MAFNISSITSSLESKIKAAAKTAVASAVSEAVAKVKTEVSKSFGTTNATGAKIPEYEKNDNNYSHESNNIVASKTPGTSGQTEVKNTFLPNVLDEFDAYTYHWKLFITTQEASSSGNVTNTADQVIIAETGVTNISIDNVIVDSVSTPTTETGTGLSTSVKFRLTEPVGAELVDQIFYQSIALGIGNWNVMPFYLELQFRARTPEMSEAESTAPGALADLKWLWQIKLSEMKANVTLTGTVYEVSAIIYNEVAQANAYSSVQHTVTLDNVLLIDDAMSKLVTVLNNDQQKRTMDTVSIPDVYKIMVDDKIAKFVITPDTHNIDSQRHDSTITFNGKNASFPDGTSIDKMIDSLIASTADAQKLMKDSITPTEDGLPLPAETNQMKKFWRIITESRPLQFDPRQNNYAREFTFIVVQYDVGILDTNITQYAAGQVSESAERVRFTTYLDKGILRKKYDYIFTGLNDQVINFDITINNAFTSAQSRMGGIYSNVAMADQGVAWQENAVKYEAAAQQKGNQTALLNNAAAPKTAAAKSAAVETVSAANSASALTPQAIERVTTLLNTAKAADRSAATKYSPAADSQAYEVAKVRAQMIAEPKADKTTGKDLNFISDIDINGRASQDAYVNYLKNVKGALRPVAVTNRPGNKQFPGVESSSNPGIQKLSSVFDVAMHSNLDVSFAKVKLVIKGDPFWLFPQPLASGSKLYHSLDGKAAAIEWYKNSHKTAPGSVNLAGTDNFIIIRFRTPRIFDAEEGGGSGTATIRDVEAISGVFKVVSLVNKFENGRFTQELDCNMDYQINISHFTEMIEQASGKAATMVPEATQAYKDAASQGELPLKDNRVATQQTVTPASATTIGPQLSSNTPTAIKNVIAGLPPIYK